MKPSLKPRLLPVTRAVGWVTFLEIVKDKILYNFVLFAILLLGVGYLASRLSYVRPDRVVLDFGMSAVNIATSMVAIFLGASVLGREFERRTVFMALSRPISRMHFLLGKFAGVAGVLFANWLLLVCVFLVILWQSDPAMENFHPTLYWGLVLLYCQSLVMASVAMLISTFSTTSLSVISSIGLYLLGNNISELRLMAVRTRSHWGATIMNSASSILPNLEHFNLGKRVTYGLPYPSHVASIATIYALLVTCLMLALSGLLIRNREV